ncbi:MAG: beta-lactamase family protein [Lachnospiraceae bacterium]|nr:beta-lactamase family protein [Lachnospiraceae bacterium]
MKIKITAAVLAASIIFTSVPTQVLAAQNEDGNTETTQDENAGTEQEKDKKTPSGTSYKDIGSKIEKWAEENADEYPSFATAVADRDGIIYEGAFGCSDRENSVKADPDETVYEWGSCSKTLVWVSALQLKEQGKLDLNEDIRNYLPDGFLQKLKYDYPITMFNLMHHSAGWGEGTWAMQVFDEKDVMDLGAALRESEPVQTYCPGEVCSYSNYGAALAGYVIECITGQPYWEYVHENIFEPLGMEHTSIKPAHDDCTWVYERRKKLVCYEHTDKGWVSKGNQLALIMDYPAGAACGTIGDMAIYARALVQEDNPLFENEETREELLSPSRYCGSSEIPMNCHGFWLDNYAYATTLGHNGGTNGGSAVLKIDSESGLCYVALMNGAGAASLEIPFFLYGGSANRAPAAVWQDYSEDDISGLYLSARAIRKGPLRFMSLLGLMPAKRTGVDEYDVMGMYKVKRLGEDVYFISDDKIGMAGSYKVLNSGVRVLNMDSSAYVTEKGLICELFLLAFYGIATVIAIFILLIKLIRLIAKKRKPYKGAGPITAAQIAKPVSLGVVAFWLSAYMTQYGIYRYQGIAGCLVQNLCAVLYAVALISSLAAIFSSAEDAKGKGKYIINFLANSLCLAAVYVLELYKFWGI